MLFITSILLFSGLLTGLALVLIVAERLLVNYGDCKIDVNAGKRTIEVKGGQPLLSVLNQEQLFIPSACGGKGSCGYCKITVLSGGGQVLPTELPYLSRKELRSMVRLACQVKIREDMQVRVPDELLDVKLFTATVESVVSLTRDMKEINLVLNDPPEISQLPGQYVQVQVPSRKEVFRAYSMSSPVYEKNKVSLVVRVVPGGLCSVYLFNLKQGEVVKFTGPFGEFRWNEDPSTDFICVGGGSGMAPMRNIIYSLYDRWHDRNCWLFFGCRTMDDVFYLDEYKKLSREHPNFHVVYALSEEKNPDKSWDGETGFIHLSVDKYLEPGGKRQAFLCGPPPMIEAVMRVLEKKGVKQSDMFYDKF